MLLGWDPSGRATSGVLDTVPAVSRDGRFPNGRPSVCSVFCTIRLTLSRCDRPEAGQRNLLGIRHKRGNIAWAECGGRVRVAHGLRPAAAGNIRRADSLSEPPSTKMPTVSCGSDGNVL